MTEENESDVSGQEDSRVYEVGYILLPSIPEEEISAKVLEIKRAIENASGKIISEEYPRTRVLAYEVVKHINNENVGFKSGFFGWIKFESHPSVAMEIKKSLDGNGYLLRFIIVKTTKDTDTRSLEVAMDGKEKFAESPQISDEEIDKSIEELVKE